MRFIFAIALGLPISIFAQTSTEKAKLLADCQFVPGMEDSHDLKLCPDGSWSAAQPSTTLLRGGLCGPTAAVNMLAIYCGYENTPRVKEFDGDYVELGISGTLPGELKLALQSAFEDNCPTSMTENLEWKRSYFSDTREYLASLWKLVQDEEESSPFARYEGQYVKRTWPLIALVENDRRLLHYVTIVDIQSSRDLFELKTAEETDEEFFKNQRCDVIYNTWGQQYRLSCQEFARWAALDNTSLSQALLEIPRTTFRPYTLIHLTPSL